MKSSNKFDQESSEAAEAVSPNPSSVLKLATSKFIPAN